jgi:hypothetical protein
VLCLHGWRTSGAILRDQMVDVAAAVGGGLGAGAVDMHYVDAPHPASGPPMAEVRAAWPSETYFEWWDKQGDGKYKGAEQTLSCDIVVLSISAGRSYYRQYDRPAAATCCSHPCAHAVPHRYIRQYNLAHGPFEGIIGFSQGGSLAATLCAEAAQAQAQARTGVAAGGCAAASGCCLPALRWAVIFSGFIPADPTLQAMIHAAAPIHDGIEALCVHGRRDFNRAASEQLARTLWDPAAHLCTTAEHGGGHVVSFRYYGMV